MPASGHSLLGASSAARWLECTPSARESERFEDRQSEFAEEGSRAHLLCESKVRAAIGLPEPEIPPGTQFDAEMGECAESYLAYALESIESAREGCPDPLALVEQRVSYAEWAPEGFGTADLIIASDMEIHVVDFKYGKGVEVGAEMNPQMMLYALGAAEALRPLYDAGTARMTIFQPRLGNVSEFSMPMADLRRWADEYVRPRAEMAFSGGGEFREGQWCRFCRCRAVCRKRAEECSSQAARLDFAEPAELTDAEISEALSRADRIAAWANDIKEYALSEAVKGRRWKGWKLVEGRSVRRYSDEAAVAQAVAGAGFDPYERKVLGVTEMTKRIGKARFDELIGPFITKPSGKPTLVPESDRRGEINDAKSDFNDKQEEK